MTPQAAVLPFTPKPSAPSFGDMLGTTAKAAPKAKKASTVVSITNATPEQKQAADDFMDGLTMKKQGEGIMAVNFPILADLARERQDADGYRGDFHSTYAVVGTKATAKVGYVNKYSLSAEDAGPLAEILGPENFNRMIVKTPTVKLKAEVFADEAMQQELMGLLGNSFTKFFDTTFNLAVVEGFNKQVYAVVPAEKLADLRIYARQNNPGIKS